MINTGQNTLRYLQAQSYPLTNKPAVVENKTPQSEARDAVQLSYTVALPNSETRTETKPAAEESKPKLKEATGDMALMLESMQRAEERSKEAGGDLLKGVQLDVLAQKGTSNSPIAVLDWGAAPNPEHSTNIDGFLASLVQAEQDKQAAAEKEKGHTQPKPNHGLLGGHLGIEGGEHLAHAHEVVAAKTHVASELASNASDAADAAVSHGSHVVKKAAAHHAETSGAAEHASNAGHAASGWVSGLTGALAAGSGVLGVVMLAVGIKDIKHGMKHGDKEHTIEGINHTVVGTRSLAAGASMAGHLVHGSEVITTIAGVAKATLTPLGVVHGAIDAGLGAKQVYDGIKTKDTAKVTKGGLGIGLGVSLVAAAVGGGVPALVAAGVFLTGKIAHGIQQRRAAKAEEQAQH